MKILKHGFVHDIEGKLDSKQGFEVNTATEGLMLEKKKQIWTAIYTEIMKADNSWSFHLKGEFLFEPDSKDMNIEKINPIYCERLISKMLPVVKEYVKEILDVDFADFAYTIYFDKVETAKSMYENFDRSHPDCEILGDFLDETLGFGTELN